MYKVKSTWLWKELEMLQTNILLEKGQKGYDFSKSLKPKTVLS